LVPSAAATAAPPKKHAVLQERGCQHVVDSHADEWPAEKMDLVLDAKGDLLLALVERRKKPAV
jgi:hypothetical protein